MVIILILLTLFIFRNKKTVLPLPVLHKRRTFLNKTVINFIVEMPEILKYPKVNFKQSEQPTCLLFQRDFSVVFFHCFSFLWRLLTIVLIFVFDFVEAGGPNLLIETGISYRFLETNSDPINRRNKIMGSCVFHKERLRRSIRKLGKNALQSVLLEVFCTGGFGDYISLLPDSNNTYWTTWLDRDNPSGDGDFEQYDVFVNTDNSVSEMKNLC
jgi:hypothetical protein